MADVMVSPVSAASSFANFSTVGFLMFRPIGASKVEIAWNYTMATLSFERLPRVEGVAHGLADEDQQRQHQRDHDEARDAEPRRVEVALALPEQLAERRRARRQAEA